MILKNIRIFQEDGSFREGTLFTNGTRISSSSGDGRVLDGKGSYAIPGLTDIHFHGCVGHDFCGGTAEAFFSMAAYQLKNGITQICPATMTLDEAELLRIVRSARDCAQLQAQQPDSASGALLKGIHMEGPFLSFAKKGAQNPQYLHRPDIEMFRRLQAASGGMIRLVDLAPEEEGALEFIRALKKDVVISIAHTAADYDTASLALQEGASHVTHLFNAMPPFSHRSPGVIGAAFDAPDCQVELICDGIHLHPAMVRAAFQLFGDDRIILISDSMRAAGLTDGEYSLGGQAVQVRGALATLADGTIAGSVTNLMSCMRRAVLDMHIPLGSAVKAAAVNPARSIGIYDHYGSLSIGKAANIVLLDEDLRIRSIVFQGRPLEP